MNGQAGIVSPSAPKYSSMPSSPDVASTPTALFWHVGLQSFQDLSTAFLATVFGGHSGGGGSAAAADDDDRHAALQQPPVICGASVPGHTYFYLNPWDDDVTWTMKARSSSSTGSPVVSCAGTDWVVLAILVVIIHAVSWWPRWFLWEPLADACKASKSKNSTTTTTTTTTTAPTTTWNREECRRFSMTVTSCMFFSLSAFFAYRILGGKEWLLDRRGWADRGAIIEADFKFYYLLYAARFISDMVSLLFESRKADAFWAAVLHHLVTLGLVFGSTLVQHTRYGGIIMFFFDWADIPLLSAKAFKYLSESPTDTLQFMANRLFEVFAVMFAATRVIWYNYIVYCAWMDGVTPSCGYLLIMLAGLQTYWMSLIVKAVIRQKQNGGVVEDSRDDDIKDKDKKANGKKD